MSRNGETVAAFERELAQYCGAFFCVAAANGTVTLQAALVALGVKPGDRIATTPLTHSATTIAILNVGAVPVFCDVNPDTWLKQHEAHAKVAIDVSLYGLHATPGIFDIDDAAQTLRKHNSGAAFTSLSFQASKILSTGEGGALLTNNESYAAAARSYLSLGYDMKPSQARIDPAVIKSPTYERHVRYPAINGRLNDITAAEGLRQLEIADELLANRARAASLYDDAFDTWGDWFTPQHVPDGWTHDYWAYAVAADTPSRAAKLQDAVERHGGERPYGAWLPAYFEPALAHLGRPGLCPTAEDLQTRLVQFQTNNLASAERNATALRRAIQEMET